MTSAVSGGRSHRAAILALALVPAVLFAPALAGGVFFQRDLHAYWQPQVETLVRVVADGALPLWDPYEGFGLPLLADPSHQVYYPPTWLNFLLLPPTVYKVLVLGHAWGAAVGTFLLARAFGLSRLSAMVAGAAWVASGPFVSTVSVPHHFMGAAWMPWVLLGLERLLQAPSLRRSVVLALLAAGQVFAGSGDMAILTAAAAALRLVAEAWRRRADAASLRPVAGLLAMAVLLSLGLSAAQWMPTLDVFRGTTRQSMPPGTNLFWSVHPWALAELVLPRAFADLPLSDTMRAMLFESREPFLSSLYLGLVPVLVVAGCGLPRSPSRAFCLAGAGLFGLASLGKHAPLVPLLARLPVLSMFRYPVKAMVPASLFWALLLGLAIEHARPPWTPAQRWRARAVAVAGAIVAVGAVALARFLVTHAEALGASLSAPPGWRTAAYEPLAAKLQIAAGLSAVAALLVAWRSLSERPHAALPALLGLVAVCDLTLAGLPVNKVAPRELLTHVPPVVKAIAAEPGDHRVFSASPSLPALNRSLVRGPAGWRPEWSYALGLQESLYAPIGSRWGFGGSYDPDFTGMAPVAADRLSSAMEQSRENAVGLRLLQMGGVTDVVALDRRTPPGLVEVGQFPSVFADPIRLLRVPAPAAPVRLVGRARHVTAGAAVDLIATGAVDPTAELLVEAEGADEQAPGFEASVHVGASRADVLTVETQANQPGWLTVTGSFAPGWRARIDGVSAPIVRANGVFRAVRVPAGRHAVDLRYRPPAVAAGGVLSLASAVAAAVLARGRKRAA
ncbi:MAG TPA: YfhO family protein [Vicinamibacteria bacterium]|nr:YfhO family protein [Vicinamibacteria bacterium]